MKWDEAELIFDEWSLKYVTNPLYYDHIHLASLSGRLEAVEHDKVELPSGESLDGLCIVIYGSIDNLPADVPKPESPHPDLPLVYAQSSGPFLPQKKS